MTAQSLLWIFWFHRTEVWTSLRSMNWHFGVTFIALLTSTASFAYAPNSEVQHSPSSLVVPDERKRCVSGSRFVLGLDNLLVRSQKKFNPNLLLSVSKFSKILAWYSHAAPSSWVFHVQTSFTVTSSVSIGHKRSYDTLEEVMVIQWKYKFNPGRFVN